MFKNFIRWFIIFGLSFLLSSLFNGNQGKIFFMLDFGISAFLVILFSIIAITGVTLMATFIPMEVTASTVLIFLYQLGNILIIVIAISIAKKIFNVDFYVAYQLMTFGQCLVVNNKGKED